MENRVNESALHIRELLINQLNFLNGEVQEFVPAKNKEDAGIAAMDAKWKSGVHFVFYQTLWRGYYYVTRNNEKISHTYHAGKYDNNWLFGGNSGWKTPTTPVFMLIKRLSVFGWEAELSDPSRPDTPYPAYFEYCESRMPCG